MFRQELGYPPPQRWMHWSQSMHSLPPVMQPRPGYQSPMRAPLLLSPSIPNSMWLTLLPQWSGCSCCCHMP
jgi:hypothetical protein